MKQNLASRLARTLSTVFLASLIVNCVCMFQTNKTTNTKTQLGQTTEQVEIEIEPTDAPTVEPTIMPTVEPTIEPTIIPTEHITPSPAPCTPTLEPDITFQYFETNKLLYTVYGEDSEWGRSVAYPYSYDNERKTSISIEEKTHQETVNGKTFYVHSIATNNSILPFGSIIYIPKLDLYFIVYDNASSQIMKYWTNYAWNRGCSFWIDIFLGYGTGYKESGADWSKIREITGLEDGLGVLEFKLIRYGK